MEASSGTWGLYFSQQRLWIASEKLKVCKGKRRRTREPPASVWPAFQPRGDGLLTWSQAKIWAATLKSQARVATGCGYAKIMYTSADISTWIAFSAWKCSGSEGKGVSFGLHQEVESWVGSFQQQRRGFVAQTAGRGAGPTWETGCAPGGSGGSSSVSCWSPWSAGWCTGGWSRMRCTNSSRGRRLWHWSTSSTKSPSRLSSKVNTVTVMWLKVDPSPRGWQKWAWERLPRQTSLTKQRCCRCRAWCQTLTKLRTSFSWIYEVVTRRSSVRHQVWLVKVFSCHIN